MKKEMPIVLPMLPNFIQVGESTLSISQFSEKELREIGEAWTDALVRKGKQKP